ncbi:hypothetical protein ACIRP2_30840 [Streptomyces sp. NPDC101194]|uniref:hypothetical protein n=1 Tax=Streptomyces sp. NPDC101194 TaxID=3366127 RepID=UPI00382337A9
MLERSETIRTAADRGCLRRVMAVPLLILHAIAAGCCYYALTIRPSGIWDKDAYGAIALSCFFTIAVSAVALLITVVPPSVRHAMGRAWLVPPVVLAAAAAVRRALVG